jgi:uncharacterized coiled-coil protein SlyX
MEIEDRLKRMEKDIKRSKLWNLVLLFSLLFAMILGASRAQTSKNDPLAGMDLDGPKQTKGKSFGKRLDALEKQAAFDAYLLTNFNNQISELENKSGINNGSSQFGQSKPDISDLTDRIEKIERQINEDVGLDFRFGQLNEKIGRCEMHLEMLEKALNVNLPY